DTLQIDVTAGGQKRRTDHSDGDRLKAPHAFPYLLTRILLWSVVPARSHVKRAVPQCGQHGGHTPPPGVTAASTAPVQPSVAPACLLWVNWRYRAVRSSVAD